MGDYLVPLTTLWSIEKIKFIHYNLTSRGTKLFVPAPIGGNGMRILRLLLLIRKKIASRLFTLFGILTVGSYRKPLKINGFTVLTKNTHLGRNTNFNGMRIQGGGRVDIGDNFHSGENILIITRIHNYDKGAAIPYDGSYIMKSVTIEDNLWIGTRVILLGGITIGEGAIIQAGAVVASDIPKHAIAGGNPAKVFKYRDTEHYNRLKKEQKYH